ncbi:MAG: sodium:solute symporter family protein [Bacillota bacterium]
MEDSILKIFSTANWILLFLGIYMLVIIALGFIYSRKVHDADDLVVAGRQLNFVFMVPSIIATWICAGAMMGAAGYGYLFGMQGVIFDPWAPSLCMILIAVFFAFRMRKAKYTTLTDYFNARYNKRMGFLYTIIQILSALAWLGGQLVALGIIVYLTTGFSLTYAVMIATLAIIIVTTAGGLWALSRVDAIGFVLIIVGLLIMFPMVMSQVGGFSEFISNAENWAELPTWSMTPVAGEEGYLWYTGILGILLYISAWVSLSLGDVPSQVLMQRALAAKDEKTAVAGFFTSGILYLLIGLIPVMVGIAVFTWGLETTVDQAEYVLPWAAYSFLPPWAGILFIVTLAAAIVSTSGDNALIISTLIGHNIYRNIKPQATGEQVLKVVRICIPIVTILAMCIALYFETVYKLIVLSGGIQLATIFAAYALGYFWKKANTTGAISSFFTGLVSWVVIYFFVLPHTMAANMDVLVEGEVYMQWAVDDAVFIALVPAAAISILTLIVVSLLTQKRDPAKPMLSIEGENLDNQPKFFWSKQA